MAEIKIDQEQVDRLKLMAEMIASNLNDSITSYSTVSVERTVLRLFGVDGADGEGIPWVNRVVDKFSEEDRLHRGVSTDFAAAMSVSGQDIQKAVEMISSPKFKFEQLAGVLSETIQGNLDELVARSLEILDRTRRKKRDKREQFSIPAQPWKYLIVATGNIYEDRLQARSAVHSGADIIAVIRSTAQSLLDYVPFGVTTEGYGGTFATQQNFKIMRQALDECSAEHGRYIQLVNYSSGLCMSEIAACAAFEDLDILLNDSMYGILFRDINMNRTFVDQHFSRLICARADIMINTGEDNYLTTADAINNAHTVTVSQLINEALARSANLMPYQMGLGHAFEVNPDIQNAFLIELAQAQLTRQLFPASPIKYMPPTKHKSADIFYSQCLDSMFNLSSVMTNQGIHLAGILTEAIHTPLTQDRHIALNNINYVFNIARDLGDEIEFRKEGLITKRANQVLKESESMMEKIVDVGLMNTIERGVFADIKRPRNGGKGVDGVFKKSDEYSNPLMDRLIKDGPVDL